LLTRRYVISNGGWLGILGGLFLMNQTQVSLATRDANGGRIVLPSPEVETGVPVERTLSSRRSVREFSGEPLSLAQISQMLWAAQGKTSTQGYRTAPSAGALYPLDVYLAAGEIAGLPVGVYRYDPTGHALERVALEDRRRQLSDAALAQGWIRSAAAVIVLTAVFRRTTRKYGERGHRYVHLEAGHAAQNVYLQAASLGLGTTTVGAFHDERVKAVLELPPEAEPLCLLPVGRPG
jgi:SagB-type dehydrogenase family enzyme